MRAQGSAVKEDVSKGCLQLGDGVGDSGMTFFFFFNPVSLTTVVKDHFENSIFHLAESEVQREKESDGQVLHLISTI